MSQRNYICFQPTSANNSPTEAQSASGNSREFPEMGSYNSAIFHLDISAVTGTLPTLDLVIEEYDPFSQTYTVIDTFPQQTAAGHVRRMIGSGSGRTDAGALFGTSLRARWTIGGSATPTFTFRLGCYCSTEEGLSG